VMDDPDAVEPAGEVWLHWLAWNVSPSRTETPGGWEPDGEHTYRFKPYTLEERLDLPDSAGKRDVGAAMQGDVLAATQLAGTFAP